MGVSSASPLGTIIIRRPAAAEALTYSGIELFDERAKASLDHFELDDADVSIVARIIKLRECRIDGAVAR